MTFTEVVEMAVERVENENYPVVVAGEGGRVHLIFDCTGGGAEIVLGPMERANVVGVVRERFFLRHPDEEWPDTGSTVSFGVDMLDWFRGVYEYSMLIASEC